LLGKVRALYRVFGWKTPAVTTFGLMVVALVVWIGFRGRKPLAWLEWATLAGFAGLLTLCGLAALRERWLSLAPLAGLRPPTYRPWPVSRTAVGVGLILFGAVLLTGGLTQPVTDDRVRWLAPLLGGCSLLAGLAASRVLRPARLHVLVREGLALRHRRGWSLVPWEQIFTCRVGTFCENVVANVELIDPAAPLSTVWDREAEEGQRQRWLRRLHAGFAQSRQWVGSDILVWGWSCGMPPGIFMLRAREALADPASRDRLPSFEEVARSPLPPGQLRRTRPGLWGNKGEAS
jgi:hypothetical protein